LRKGIEFGL